MMWKEFEEIAGYEVSYEDYTNIIEPMYMATNLSKQEFVKVINKKSFALKTKQQYRKEMKQLAKHLYDICGHRCDYEAEEKLDKLAKEYAKRFYGLDWSNDINTFVFFVKEYGWPELGRGCTYPARLVIGKGDYEYEIYQLV